MPSHDERQRRRAITKAGKKRERVAFAQTHAAKPESPISMECDQPVEEQLFYERQRIRLVRTHCIDKMGPDKDGYFEFYYDYENLAFSLGGETLHARTYAKETEASLRSIEVGGEIRALSPDALTSTLVRAAVDYFRSKGRDQVRWLNPADAKTGYTLIRRKQGRAAT